MRRWIYSTNAKDIGTLYIIFALIAGLIGTSMSMLMRMELGGTGNNILASSQTYNILITAHGFVMIFFLIMPSLLGGYGNLGSGPFPSERKPNITCIRLEYCSEANRGLNCAKDDESANEASEGLKEYLAGLIEGDGSIIVPKEGRRGNPNIKIAFNGKDKRLAQEIKDKLKVGEISKGNGNYVLLQIRRKEDLIKIVNKINGKMRTPKIEALGRLINWLNKKNDKLLTLNNLDKRSIGSSGWLAGFSDADGYFNITIQEKRGRVARIRGVYRLEIRQKYHREEREELGGGSYMGIMMEIAEYLGVNLLSRRRRQGESVYESYIVTVTRRDSKEKLGEYLTRYPLYSSKKMDYDDWKKVRKIVEEGGHKKKEGLEECKRLKDGMNKGRVTFSWKHLER